MEVNDYLLYKNTRFEKKLGVELSEKLWDELLKENLDDSTKNIKLSNDWVNAIKKGDGWTKYGRMMYSKKINKLRSQTMMEFYGKGMVD